MSDMPGIKATPQTYKSLEAIATILREKFKITGMFPANKLEYLLESLFRGTCTFRVADDIEEEGRTLLNGSGMVLRSNVYDALIEHNEPRARFTAMHELAHRILHCKPTSVLARSRGKVEIYCDPEWQADALAGAILCPAEEIKSKQMGVEDIMKEYQVSRPCAEKRFKVVREKF